MGVADLEATLGLALPGDLRALLATSDPPLPGGRLDELLSCDAILAARLPGLPVDLIPLVNDGSGSYLCARITPDGRVAEMTFWEHDDLSYGLPMGRSIAEALLIDAASSRFAERAAASVRFALGHGELAPALRTEVERSLVEGTPLGSVLLARGVGVETLGMPWKEARGSRMELVDPMFVRYYEVEEELAGHDFWYSLEGLPPKARAALEEDYGGLAEPAWEVIERATARVLAKRDDIGWAWVLAADAAGKRGDRDAARRAITMASRCLARTFAVHGRELLRGVRAWAAEGDPLVAAFLARDADASAAHFQAVAEAASLRGDWAAAWDAWYRHVHQQPRARVDDDALHDRYAHIAKTAGYAAFERLLALRSR